MNQAEMEKRIQSLETELQKLQKRSGRSAWAYNDTETPFIIANTYDDLQRIKVAPPAMAWVRYQRKVEAVVTYDDLGRPTDIQDKVILVPASRYFVLTYPPAPKLDSLTMRDIDGHEVTWETQIYQPSAGLSGAQVYFDQGIQGDLNTMKVGATLGYSEDAASPNKNPLYKITHVQSFENERGETMISSIVVDYANGMKTSELAWLEIDILPPWGNDIRRIPLDPDYRTNWELPVYVPPDVPEG